MTILVFLKGPSDGRIRREVDPGKVYEQDGKVWWGGDGSMVEVRGCRMEHMFREE